MSEVDCYACRMGDSCREHLPKPFVPVDPVNHPPHYGGADNPFEHVKVAEALGWVDNAFIYTATKYIWRFGVKTQSNKEMIIDLKKAVWYLQREIERRERA